MKKVTIGGNRLGSGKKIKAEIRGFERSTHDLSYVWRSTMASGTLVPFMSQVALKNDTWDIELNCSVLTHPTIAPLFGSYKVQLDLFECPIRLYQAELHMNKLGIGLKMENVKLPTVLLEGDTPNLSKEIDNQQINSSCIFSYLGIRGIGYNMTGELYVEREFTAIDWIAYWDIYKNYYANKQEEIGVVIHNPVQPVNAVIESVFWMHYYDQSMELVNSENGGTSSGFVTIAKSSSIIINLSTYEEFDVDRLYIFMNGVKYRAKDVMLSWMFDAVNSRLVGTECIRNGGLQHIGFYWFDTSVGDYIDVEPKLKTFPLKNIDDFRMKLLKQDEGVRYKINDAELEPYCLPLRKHTDGDTVDARSILSSQEGLAIKTYQNDLFNNWVNTEWIDGDNGINAVTSVNVVDNKFTIDEFNMKKKVY